MRYTKYNYKKGNTNQFTKLIISIVVTVIIAGVTGYGLGKVIFQIIPKNNLNSAINDNKVASESNNDTKANANNVVNTSLTLVQCGYFSKQENASQALNKLNGINTAFIHEEEGKFRVVAGIYEEAKAESMIADLKTKGVESAKVQINFNPKDGVQSQLAAISDGYLALLNQANASDVKKLDTTELKKWISNLKEINKGEGVEDLNTFKKYISGLPNQINKEDISKEVNNLYNILIKYKEN